MDQVTKAKINLFAVLRNIEDLCELDEESKKLIAGQKIGVQFSVPEVGTAVLTFKDGKCTFTRGKGKASLKLWFTSAEHFNKLIDGEKTVPVFFNVFQVKFLLDTFTKLAERLVYYLQPTDEERAERNKDENYFKTSTLLTAYTAFFALAEIGNSDSVGKRVAKTIPNGMMHALIYEGDEVFAGVSINAKDGKLTTEKGLNGTGRAFMEFHGVDTAYAVLNGTEDLYSLMGKGKMSIQGFVPMMEMTSKLLGLVAVYLA